MDHSLEKIAIQAVGRAAALARLIQRELTDRDTLYKHDRSPVTVADFVSQAVICGTLSEKAPGIPIVGEENSRQLLDPQNSGLLEKISRYLQPFNPRLPAGEIIRLIDLAGAPPDGTFWVLDPIDGTKGFLRGEQFAVALALISDGHVQLGVLGCPNLLRLGGSRRRTGFLFAARRGHGARLVNPDDFSEKKITVSTRDNGRLLRVVESYESSHSNREVQHRLARELGIRRSPRQLDGQVKYGIVAGSGAEIYWRIPGPANPGYREKIWDHAAGTLIVQEAGGRVSDVAGNELDFRRGICLENNTGILASNGRVHERVLQALRRYL